MTSTDVLLILLIFDFRFDNRHIYRKSVYWFFPYRNIYIYIYIYIYKVVTRPLRLTKVHRARRVNKDSPSKPHSKHERSELRKMRGWTTSDVKKIKNLIKTFRSETFVSYLKIITKAPEEDPWPKRFIKLFIFLRQKLSILAFFLTLCVYIYVYRYIYTYIYISWL